jgi:hypothetical protein
LKYADVSEMRYACILAQMEAIRTSETSVYEYFNKTGTLTQEAVIFMLAAVRA